MQEVNEYEPTSAQEEFSLFIQALTHLHVPQSKDTNKQV